MSNKLYIISILRRYSRTVPFRHTSYKFPVEVAAKHYNRIPFIKEHFCKYCGMMCIVSFTNWRIKNNKRCIFILLKNITEFIFISLRHDCNRWSFYPLCKTSIPYRKFIPDRFIDFRIIKKRCTHRIYNWRLRFKIFKKNIRRKFRFLNNFQFINISCCTCNFTNLIFLCFCLSSNFFCKSWQLIFFNKLCLCFKKVLTV